MGLPAPCLPIGKHCPVVAFEHGLNETEGALIVNRLLLRVLAVDDIESEGAGDTLRLTRFKQLDLTVLAIHLDHTGAA